MATLVFTDAFVWINGVDLSDDVAEVRLNYRSETVDETAMGDTTRVMKGGLKAWDIDVTFHQDYAAGGPHATLFGLVGTTACFELRPKNSCSTQINPNYTGIGILEAFPPVGGRVGELLDVAARLVNAGALTKASSS